MKRKINTLTFFALLIASIVIAITIDRIINNESLSKYIMCLICGIFCLFLFISSLILNYLDKKKPLSENKEDGKTNKFNSSSLFPSQEEIENASKIEMLEDDK